MNSNMFVQEIVAIIDRSGSMSGKESDTIGGINVAIQDLKDNKTIEEEINFSVKFFDDQENVYLRRLPIENLRPLKVSDLKPRGQTALFDAMGNSLVYFINQKMKNPNIFNSCVIYVCTDGLENCSKNFNAENIKNLIKTADSYNIKLLYMGSNQDSILEANKFGLTGSQALNYSEITENVQGAYRRLAAAAKRHRTGEDLGFSEYERQQSQA